MRFLAIATTTTTATMRAATMRAATMRAAAAYLACIRTCIRTLFLNPVAALPTCPFCHFVNSYTVCNRVLSTAPAAR